MQLSLAITNFQRESGTKSKMTELYERMLDIDQNISLNMEDQQIMIYEAISQLYGAGRDVRNCAKKLSRCNFPRDSDCEILARILSATYDLKKELDDFRACCNNLISVEGKRNMLGWYHCLQVH